jgi:hypothetical protein
VSAFEGTEGAAAVAMLIAQSAPSPPPPYRRSVFPHATKLGRGAFSPPSTQKDQRTLEVTSPSKTRQVKAEPAPRVPEGQYHAEAEAVAEASTPAGKLQGLKEFMHEVGLRDDFDDLVSKGFASTADLRLMETDDPLRLKILEAARNRAATP